MKNKICTRCKTKKPLTDFSPRTDRLSKKSACRVCEKAYQKEYRKKTKGKYKETVSRWQKKHPVKIREAYLRWCKNNPEKNKEKNKRANIKKLSTIRGRLTSNIRSLIGFSLRGNKKNRHWETLVGYTLEQLKKHIEKQFKQGMTWKNYGRNGWHIDHKIPISRFNFSQPEHLDFKKCWTLKNLQPLWAKENTSKGNKIDKHFQPSLRLGVE